MWEQRLWDAIDRAVALVDQGGCLCGQRAIRIPGLVEDPAQWNIEIDHDLDCPAAPTSVVMIYNPRPRHRRAVLKGLGNS